MKRYISILITIISAVCILSGAMINAQAFSVTKILEFDLNDYKNETVKDNTGYDITLSKVGDGSLKVIDGVDGKKAVWFDRAGLGVPKLMLNLGRQYTVCATVKFNKDCPGGRVLGTGIYELGGGFTLMSTNDGNWLFDGAANYEEQFICLAISRESEIATDIYDGKWHNVAMVVNLDEYYTRLYVDGGLESVYPWSNANVKRSDDGTYVVCKAEFESKSNQAFALGCGGIGDNAYVDFNECGIQKFTIYDKAFTLNEYRALLGLPGVEGGDKNDPTVTETVSKTITYKSNSVAPNNKSGNAMREAGTVVFMPSADNSAAAEASDGGKLTVISAVAVSVSALLLAAAVIFLILKRKRWLNNVGE